MGSGWLVLYIGLVVRGRDSFWEELHGLVGLCWSRWCIGGDFNVIRRLCEKLGVLG